MKLKFDSQQTFQLEAIQSIVDLFGGQRRVAGQFGIDLGMEFTGSFLSELGFANNLTVSKEKILSNLQEVQTHNRLALSPKLDGMNFSVEMETGTGKTYVYLRTIHELHQQYGLSKFIIIVPSVAIREGVLKSLELTREHFRSLYDYVPVNAFVYDSKHLSALRSYANSNGLQIMVMNIDAFNKDSNVIRRAEDLMSGRKPLDFIQATRPVVIIDEPQNMESEQSKAAILSLNPLCTLRYSATHRERYNLVYRLGPVAAYDLNLVKHIEVAGVLDQPTFGQPYLQVKSIKATKTRITAQLEIDVNGKDGPKRRTILVSSNGVDLFDKSNEREAYQGYIVSEINAADEFVAFSNGVRLYLGETHGDSKDAVMRFQIETTIREHLEKEMKVNRLSDGQRLKVLSLFFIDRVANYNDGDGKIRSWFTEAYTKLASEPAYAALNLPPVDQVHNGYFATTNKGEAKDTNGNTKADDEAYQLIMRDKERLLERSEPLRFIFSHSALREGWDNPNVFQICTLNETKSEVRKRQEIGRGLRLPVLESGERCFDQAINKLVVVANESYDDFARALQKQIEEETGEHFSERIKPVSERKTARFRDEQLHPYFEALWEKIKYKTRYSVDYDTGELIQKAAKALEQMGEIAAPKVQLQKVSLEFSEEGIETRLRAVREDSATPQPFAIPDLIGYLQKETELTRGTLAQILIRSNRLDDVEKNPQQFLDNATKLIKATLHRLMIDGIQYHRLEDQAYEMELFKKEIGGYESNMLPVVHSIYDAVIYDSSVERDFAEGLDGRAGDATDEMRFYFKLPDWFKISTPIGNYNPDWGIVKENGKRLYLIRETKSVTDLNLASGGQLRGSEEDKIICGRRHFDALVEVDYAVENSPLNV